MAQKKPLCLITGGAGFIGSHLADELLRRDLRVRVVDNFSNGREENLAACAGRAGFELVRGDITSFETAEAVMRGADFVFHLACLGVRHSLAHPVENHRVNAEGTLCLLSAALKHKVRRFLYCSSSEIYGTARVTPMPEDHPARPATVYGSSKLAGEAYARAFFSSYGLPSLVVRPFNSYGPRSHHEGDCGEFIPKSIVRALNGEDILIFGDGSQTRDFMYVEDTARGLAEAAFCEEAVGGTYNLGNGRAETILALGEKIRKAVGRDGVKLRHLPPRPGDVLALEADSRAFFGLVDFKPRVGFDEGLGRTVAFFRDHPRGVGALIGEEKGANWELYSP